MGSKNPSAYLEPLCFSARHGSKNSGFVLRPLSPCAVASVPQAPGRPVSYDGLPASPLHEEVVGKGQMGSALLGSLQNA